MLLDVVIAPAEIPVALAERPGATCAVIDVVRATTTLTVLGERGARHVFVAGSLDQARELQSAYPAALLAGEFGGLAPPGFAFGNSPAAFARADIQGRDLIFATTNGTRAIHACQAHGAGNILMASLRNAGAIASLALTQPETPFLLVCAGRQNRAALDDLYTAGVIAEKIQQRAQAAGKPLALTEGAVIARQIAASAGTPLDVLRQSEAGQAVIAIALAADLPLCAAVGITDSAPRVTGTGPHGEVIVEFAR